MRGKAVFYAYFLLSVSNNYWLESEEKARCENTIGRLGTITMPTAKSMYYGSDGPKRTIWDKILGQKVSDEGKSWWQ